MMLQKKSKKKQNMQQPEIRWWSRPPNYYAAGRMLEYALADRMACFSFACGRMW